MADLVVYDTYTRQYGYNPGEMALQFDKDAISLNTIELSISVTHVLALVTSVLALACWHLLQCIFDLLPLNMYSWGHHPLKCFFKALANALETVVALMGDEANAFF